MMLLRLRAYSLARPIRGFTLIEMAIVLSVVGAITAALWGGFSVLSYRAAVSRGADQIGQFANNVRSLYSGRSLFTAAANCPASYSSSLVPSISSGVYPTEMINKIANVANNPWNQKSATATAKVDLCQLTTASPSSVHLAIRFTNLAADVCADLVTQTSQRSAGMSLDQIIVTSGSATTFKTQIGYTGTNVDQATGSIDPVAASAACSTNGATIDWYYKLGG